MSAANPKVVELDEEDRQVLESMLVEFDRSWTEDLLAKRVRELPPHSPLRLPALVEMIKIDLERQWQRGRLMAVEAYLSTYPELGTPDTVPADLIQAEYEVRRQFGRPVDLLELSRRFPRQAEQLQRLVEQARQVASDAGLEKGVGNLLCEAPSGPCGQKVPDPDPFFQPGLPRAETVSFHEGTTVPPTGPAVHIALTQPPTGAATSNEPPGRPAAAASGADWAIGQFPEKFGRYRIVKCLGQGGMGAVYLAHDTQLDRRVAIKIPHFDRDAAPEVLERFYRESRAAATLDHPNICPVYDVGEIDGVHYLVMAYVEGKPLSDFIRAPSPPGGEGRSEGAAGKPIPLRQVAAIVRKLALALQEAHSHGVVHRDLKPANIMANKRRELVIMDLGLARLMKKSSESESRLTQSGVVMGTPSYMPPEQVMGDVKAMGPACDIYSLGVIMYELLTGRLPFQGVLTAVLAQIVVDQPTPPSQHRSDIDPELEAICLRAMAKKIEDRYASMAELAKALGDYLAGRSPAADRQARPAPLADRDRPAPVGPERTRGSRPAHAPADKPAKGGTQAIGSPRPRDDRDRGRTPKQPVSVIGRVVDENLQQFFAAAVDEETPLARSKLWRSSAKRPSRFLNWPWLAAAGAAVLLVLGGIIYIATNKGTIKIDLNDPDAVVRVDGDVITIEELGEPITLRAGEHELVVKRGDIEMETRTFIVRRGNNPALRVEMQEKEKLTVKQTPTGSAVPPSQPAAAKSATSTDDEKALAIIKQLGGKWEEAPNIPGKPVTVVDLHGTQLTDDGLAYLSRLPRLEELRVGGSAITDDGLAQLRGLTTLRKLNVNDSAITDAGLEHLKGMASLEDLSLGGTQITDAGLEHFRHLPQLRNLHLGYTRVTDEGLKCLRGLTGLQKLLIYGTAVTDAGLQHIEHLSSLQELDLRDTKISDAGLAHLKGLTKLKSLGLDNTKVGDNGLSRLSGLIGLTHLALNGTQVTDASVDSFKGFTNLQFLYVGGTKITDEGMNRIRQALPRAGILPSRDEATTATTSKTPPAKPEPATVGEVRRFAGHTDAVWGVAFSADGRQLWTGSSDGTVRIWERDTGATVRQIELRGGRITRVAFADDFRAVLTCHPRDKFVRIWNTESGQEIGQLQGHASPVWSISLSPDGRRALAGAEDGALRLWDVNTRNEIGRFDGHTGLVQSVVFSPDGRRALSGSQDRLVCLWNLETGKRLQIFEGHTGKVCSLAFSSDGRRAVSGGGGVDARGQPADTTVRVWDLERGQELQCLHGHTNGVTGVAFTPDARHVISASYDMTVRVWDVQTGKELHRFEGHAKALECVGVSPDGRFAVSGGHDTVVRLWRLPVPEASVANAAPAAEESQSLGRWISIMPTAEEVSRTSIAKYENGILRIQGEWAAFSSGTLQARNAIIRVVVKKLEGESIDLNLRDDGLTYKAQYSGDGRFAIRKSVSENGKIRWVNLANGRSPKPLDDFFEFAFKAADDLLTVEVDGTEVVRVRDPSYDRAAFLKFGVFRGLGQFKKAEIKLLDDAPAATNNTAPADSWGSLFNGKDLTGWRKTGVAAGWSVENGEIVAEGGQPRQGAKFGWLMTEKDYSNFELELEFATAQGTDSGVAFRCDPGETLGNAQAEIQIADEQDAELVRKLDEVPYRRTGALAGQSAVRTVPSLERGRWHTMTIELRDRQLKVTVDGTVTVDTNLNQHVEQGQKMNRRGIWQPSGPIGLQKMWGTVRFRNIRVRELNATTAAREDGLSGAFLVEFAKDKGWSFVYEFSGTKMQRKFVKTPGIEFQPIGGEATVQALDAGKLLIVHKERGEHELWQPGLQSGTFQVQRGDQKTYLSNPLRGTARKLSPDELQNLAGTSVVRPPTNPAPRTN